MSLFVDLSTNPTAFVRQILPAKATVSNFDIPMADNVVLTIQLPVSFQFNSVAPTQGTCTSAGNQIVCNLGSIEFGGTVDVNFTVVPTRPGVFLLSASATGTEGGFPTSSNTASAIVRIAGSPLNRFRVAGLGLITCDTSQPACCRPFMRRGVDFIVLRP